MGDNTSWADLNKDGRRLEKIIKQMNTAMDNTKDHELKFAYVDRIIKATNSKANIAEIVLNVKQVLRDAKKITA